MLTSEGLALDSTMRLTYFVRANTLDFHIISVEYSLFHPDVPSIQKNTLSFPLMYLHGILLSPKLLDCAIMHCRTAAKLHSRAGYLRRAIFHQALWTRGGLQTYKHKQTEKQKAASLKRSCVCQLKKWFPGSQTPSVSSCHRQRQHIQIKNNLQTVLDLCQLCKLPVPQAMLTSKYQPPAMSVPCHQQSCSCHHP